MNGSSDVFNERGATLVLLDFVLVVSPDVLILLYFASISISSNHVHYHGTTINLKKGNKLLIGLLLSPPNESIQKAV